VARAFFLHNRQEISEDFSEDFKMGVATWYRIGNSSAHLSGTCFPYIQVIKHRIRTGKNFPELSRDYPHHITGKIRRQLQNLEGFFTVYLFLFTQEGSRGGEFNQREG